MFANAAFFTERLATLVANAGAGLKCVILDADAERLGVDLWIARANGPLRQLLTATELTTRLGAEHIYPTVRAAVTAYQAQFGTP